jgi:hypothetical protein
MQSSINLDAEREAFVARLKWLQKNSFNEATSQWHTQQGLKPRLILGALSARVNSRPDTRPHPGEFFSSL